MLLYFARQEYEESAAWLRKAAEQGNRDAQNVVGKLCRLGRGTKRDEVEAYKWLKLAQMQGDVEAEKELRVCMASMSSEQILLAEQKVKEFQEKHR
jgi:uncharacterized protein